MRPLMLAVLAGVLLALGCSKEETSDNKPAQPRRMLKPGEKAGTQPKANP
jgi:hypothetical protein